ncbi:MAG: hypothetical protein ACXAAM_00160 [Candidatus Heimdallarchaeaceae archaeon]|jgi:hypothetical protein
MQEEKIITDIEQLTPEWLTTIFKKNGFLSNGKVKAIPMRKPIEAFSSKANALEITFSEDDIMKFSSLQIIIKIASPKKELDKFFSKKEVEFYNLIAEEWGDRLVPICYDAKYSEETGHSHIILEDLSSTHNEYKMTNWLLPPLKSYYEKAIDCLAEIHAHWWDHERLTEISKYSYFFSNFGEPPSDRNKFSIISFPPKYEDENEILLRMLNFLGDRISDRRKEIIRKVFTLYPQIIHNRIIEKNITLVNCDAHIHHFFFPKETGNDKTKVKFIDWQGWSLGLGCKDLAYMIGLWWYSDMRSILETDLIKRYHAKLIEFGVRNYSWEKCWMDYKLCTFLNLYRSVLWWALDTSPYLWWGSLERSLSTIEDLKCMELLED